MSTISISNIRPSRAKIEIDGVDISNAVRSFTLTHGYGEHPRLELELAMVDITSLDAPEAEYLLTARTRDALLAMGWTPPAAEQ